MSTILDALRKAQNEQIPNQSHKNKRGADNDSLLSPRHNRPIDHTNRRVYIIGCLGALILSLTAWFLYGLPKKQIQPAATISTPLPASSSRNQSKTVPATAPQSAVPVSTYKQPHTQTIRDDEETAPTPPPSPRRSAPQPSVAVRQQNRNIVHTAPEGVKISGIAWHDLRLHRRAVVNDALVSEGETTAGAKVIEIKQHAVVIEKSGVLYEVVLP